eukprot:6209346-Pleurochrysis_carterae.AAC.1
MWCLAVYLHINPGTATTVPSIAKFSPYVTGIWRFLDFRQMRDRAGVAYFINQQTVLCVATYHQEQPSR